jgi:hypothetical protein
MSTTAEQELERTLAKELVYSIYDWRGRSAEYMTIMVNRWEEKIKAYAHSRITSLAEEAEREAEAHYNIAPPHRYHADLDQCKFKRAIAAWLRQKAEEREGSI